MREGSHSPVVMLTPRASRSCRKWPRPEPRDPTEDLGEQRSRHRHFGQLEHDVAAVADDSGTDLDQLLEQGGERPLLDVLRQRQRAQEVGETVGERVQLEAYSVVPEGVRSDARSVLAGVREFDHPLERVYTTKSDGIGIGLTIGRPVIKIHQGQSWATLTHTKAPSFSSDAG